MDNLDCLDVAHGGGWPGRLLPQRDEEARGGVAGVGGLVPPRGELMMDRDRTGKTLNGVTQTYLVDDGDKLTSITQGGATVKGYDAAGRTTSVVSSAGTTTLTYDFESRVKTIAGPGVSNSFTYNGLDTRVGKVDSSGTSTYRRDGAGVTAPVLSDGSAVYTPGVSQRRAGATTFDLSDRLGTALRQTDAAKNTAATRSYDAFGMLVASTGTPKGPFGFAGDENQNAREELGD